MKLQFKYQDFQAEAVDAVADLFLGQEKSEATFSIVQADGQMDYLQNDFGIGNALRITPETMLTNMHEIQTRNKLPLTDGLRDRQFSIEMETGTGKTYVYIKTILELHKRYGFTKFIIVVPSVAIREGVDKSFAITREHFAVDYDNVPYHPFVYNSAKLSDVRQFATAANIEIMIINIDAFRKAENIINQAQDKLNGETAMRYIQDTNPIVIIDEPQSVDNTVKAKEAIASLKPMCVLRYSATHREKVNLLYRLTPVDAYQMGLVKQICVSSNTVAGGFNQPYVKLLSVSNDKGFLAKIELDVQKNGKVTRKAVTVKPGSDLFLLSGEREMYDGYTVAGIDCSPGFEYIEFGNTETLPLGKAIGDVDENIIKRAQIRRTIETHLEKELRYFEHGIKVLSLFFIDEVQKYRTAEGKPGVYAAMFEECYEELLALPKFAALKDRFPTEVTTAHNGYFSQDKKGHYKNTKGDTKDDDDTYNTIMKDKEWLLSFECPLRFIFSHSALKEGWDNPNVFQVCTLLDQKSTFTCRQKIGRGLRLCVNQAGERIEDRNINLLHVMANEGFAEFADTLQKELETETGVRFGILDIGLFTDISIPETVTEEKPVTPAEAEIVLQHLKGEAELPPELEPVKAQAAKLEVPTAAALVNLTYTATVITEKQLSSSDAQEIITHFETKGYISKSGKIKDTLKSALQQGTLDLPAKFEAARERFIAVIRNADRKVPIRDASRDVVVRLNKRVVTSPEFLELWSKIKQKTVYRVNVDTATLIERSVKKLVEMAPIPKTRLLTQTADINIESQGVTHRERGIKTTDVENTYTALPDILAVVGEQSLVKRSTVYEILTQSGRLADFLNNPQTFIENCVEIIRNVRHELAIDGISYKKLEGEEFYIQEIFDSSELIANLDRNAIKVERSVYDYIIYDSETVEKPFALALDRDEEVKMFFKIPSRFKIETPIGEYWPDWAVYLDRNGEKKLYFVLESKGSTDLLDLRTREQLKIHCGREHFKALGDDIDFQVAKDWKTFKKNI